MNWVCFWWLLFIVVLFALLFACWCIAWLTWIVLGFDLFVLDVCFSVGYCWLGVFGKFDFGWVIGFCLIDLFTYCFGLVGMVVWFVTSVILFFCLMLLCWFYLLWCWWLLSLVVVCWLFTFGWLVCCLFLSVYCGDTSLLVYDYFDFGCLYLVRV